MKTGMRFFVLAVFILSTMLAFTMGSLVTVYADTFDVQQWMVVEIPLTSSTSYTNPFRDVDVSCTFSGPGGISMTMPGFWDGGSIWKIRFAPTVTGTWTYTTACSNTSDTGLHNKTGTINCTDYTGNLDIYKKGFVIKRSANNRYLTYNDGSPFFYLADTHWMGLSYRERLNSSNDSRWESMFKGMVDTRAKQGYSVYKVNFFAGEWGDVSKNGTYQ